MNYNIIKCKIQNKSFTKNKSKIIMKILNHPYMKNIKKKTMNPICIENIIRRYFYLNQLVIILWQQG